MRAQNLRLRALRWLAGVAAAAVLVPAGVSHADGYEDPGAPDVPGAPGPYEGQPEYMDNSYQPPAEPGAANACFDENNQAYDCSQDAEFATYNQVDDGYDPQAYQDFQQTLAPYGEWTSTPEYGYVWTPSASVVGYDFTPYYSGGRWNLTDYGWTWASDWDWGWAPFHYGRWVTVHNRWSWVPGRIWGPAWVHWRHGGGYVGWTPLPPRGYRIPPPVGGHATRWSFVPAPQIAAPRLARVAPVMLPGLYSRTMPGNVMRSVGTTRVNVGPLPHTLSLNLRPAPLRGISVALPRAQVSLGSGIPMASRPYISTVRPAPVYNPGGSIPLGPRPGPTWGGQRPGYQAPTWNNGGRPGYQPAPTWNNGGPRPGYQPAPTWNGGQPHQAPASPPVYQRPSWGGGHQAPASPPVYQRPSFQPAPTSPPVHQAPSWGGGHQAPSSPRPSFQPAPSYSPPVHQAPSWGGGHQAPSSPRPSFQPAPSYSPRSAPSAPSGGGRSSAPSQGGRAF